MEKEVRNYLSIGFLVLAALILAYLFNLGMTGYVVSDLPLYENQTACENASAEYVWYGEACYDGQPVCDVGFLELCLDETNCTGAEIGNGSWYDGNCYDGQPVCDVGFLELCVEADCTGVGYWYDDVCNAEVEPSCINDLSLCLDEINCVEMGSGYWYDANNDNSSTCNAEVEPSCSNDVTLCDQTNCVSVGSGFWYNSVCHVDECASDDDCNSGYECSAGSCVAMEEEEEEEEEETISEDTGSEFNPYTTTRASLGDIQEITLSPGSSKEVSMIVTNTGTGVLSSCILKPLGEYDSWILVSEEAININIEDQHEFSFNVMVPEETEEGSYSLTVSVDECLGTPSVKAFTVNIEDKKLEFNITNADRTRDDRVRVIYSLEELSGNDQDVVFIFSLVDANNIEVGRVEVNQSIDANSSDEFRTNIEINESLLPINETTNETLESELTLHVNFNSQIYSSSIQEKVLIGAPIGGFAILEGVGPGEAIVFIVVLFVLVFILVFARRMRKQGKTLRDLLNRK